jgi:nickel-dependent lactate racemase
MSEKEDKIMGMLTSILEKVSKVEQRQDELESKLKEQPSPISSPREKNMAITQALSEALSSPKLDEKVQSDLDKTVEYVIKTGKSRPYLFA